MFFIVIYQDGLYSSIREDYIVKGVKGKIKFQVNFICKLKFINNLLKYQRLLDQKRLNIFRSNI